MALTGSANAEKKRNTKDKIVFNEALHRYYLNGTELISVTKFIEERFERPFDPLGVAKGMKFHANKKGKACKNPIDQVKIWNLVGKRARSRGTAVHTYAEIYDIDKSYEPVDGYEKAVKRFIDDHDKKYVTVQNEALVGSQAYRLGGTVDKISKNKETGKYAFFDYKTSTDLDKYYNKMLNEMKCYPQSKRMGYSVQLSIYDVLSRDYIPQLRDAGEIDKYIVKLEPCGNYEVIATEDVMKEVKLALEDRTDYDELLKGL